MKILLLLLLLIKACCAQSTELVGHCRAKLRVNKEAMDKREDTLALDIAIEFLDGQQMLFFIEGMTAVEGKEYTISRYINFNYKRVGADFYLLHRRASEKLNSDTYPDNGLIDYFGVEFENPKYHILKFYNGYLFANVFSPLFICQNL
ncbi:hypothetical protein [Intestinirhabdus alba]|nr:hypothetical protein [Intestinirhabdus alba]